MKGRNLVVSVILCFVTCGIYSIIWYVSIIDEIRFVSHKEYEMSGIAVFLLSLVTCGIFGIYYWYKIGQMLDEAQTLRNYMPKNNSMLYVILSVLGLSLVNMCIAQNELNTLAGPDGMYNF